MTPTGQQETAWAGGEAAHWNGYYSWGLCRKEQFVGAKDRCATPPPLVIRLGLFQCVKIYFDQPWRLGFHRDCHVHIRKHNFTYTNRVVNHFSGRPPLRSKESYSSLMNWVPYRIPRRKLVSFRTKQRTCHGLGPHDEAMPGHISITRTMLNKSCD